MARSRNRAAILLLLLVCASLAASFVSAAPSVFNLVKEKGINYAVEEEPVAPGSTAFWVNASIALLCVIMAALAAGLTMGMVSIDPLQMEVVLETDEADCATEEEVEKLRREKSYARRLLPLLGNHHLLLVTLLLLNSAANECLPIFLDKLVPESIAIVLSVTFVLLFGEIIPSAIFTGPNQFKIAATLSPLVYFFTFTLYVVAWPIAKLLDLLLGKDHEARYRRAGLKALVKLHKMRRGHASAEDGKSKKRHHHLGHGGLTEDEVMIMHGAMDLKNLTAADVLIKRDELFMLSTDTKLTGDVMASMIASGHSRIPVYEDHKDNLCGLLLVKRLIVLDPEDERVVGSLGLRQPIYVRPDLPLLDLLNEFQTGKSHMAVITNDPETVRRCAVRGENNTEPVLGLCTFEDVIEKLIKEKIADETDEDHGVQLSLTTVGFIKRRAMRLKHLADRVKSGKSMKKRLTEDLSVGSFRTTTYGSAEVSSSSSPMTFPTIASSSSVNRDGEEGTNMKTPLLD